LRTVTLEGAAVPYPPRWRAWWFIGILFLVTCLSNIDRLVLSVVVDPIRADLHLSDVQMSLLLGAAYGAFYGPFGLVLGICADRFSRRGILVFGVLLWSCATVATGLSHGFAALFLSRALVGLGEASVVPAALSALVDFFPPRYRGRPVAFYLMGASLGTGLAILLPGQIIAAHWAISLPGYGLLSPWRQIFLMCGLLGPLVTLLFVTVREPARRGVVLGGTAGGQGVMAQNLRYLARHWAVFTPLYVGFGAFMLATIGVLSWQAVFLMRHFHLVPKDIGAGFGLAMAASGAGGYLIGGLVTDSRWARDYAGRTAVLAACCLFSLPCACLTTAATPAAAIVMLSSLAVCGPITNVAMNAVMQEIAPSRMRGFAISVNGLTSTLISFCGGPLLVSLATEKLFRGPADVGAGIAVVVAPTLMVALACFLLVRRNIRRSVRLGDDLAATVASAATPAAG
jgi:MFS family permease